MRPPNPPQRRAFRVATASNYAGLSKPETEKMILDKQDCIASIAEALNRTSVWRKSLVAKFADDPRNVLAAATLDKLAINISQLTDEQWFELKPYFGGWAAESWRKGLSKAARQVGFHHKARDVKAFVKSLIFVMSLPSVAA
jgi:hypothetical protein